MRASLTLAPMAALAGGGGARAEAEGVRELRVVRELKDAYLRSISPDGKKFCVYFTKHPNTIFRLRQGGKGQVEAGNSKEERLAVIQTESWETVYSGQFAGAPATADFLAESSALYLELAVIPGNPNESRMTLDLAGGRREPRVHVHQPGEIAKGYRALDDNALLGVETSSSPYKHDALLRTLLPDYEDVKRVAFADPVGAEPDGYESFPVIAAGRGGIVYAFGHTIVSRRAKDLGVSWAAQLDKRLFGARTLAISASGGRVAAAVVDTPLWDRQREFYVTVYDGRDGTPVTRIEVNGDQGLAISPDGESLAVAKRFQRGRDIDLIVEIYEIASGQLLARGAHDRVPPGRYRNLNGVLDHENGLQFTSDGRYLVTSGNNRVKIWGV